LTGRGVNGANTDAARAAGARLRFAQAPVRRGAEAAKREDGTMRQWPRCNLKGVMAAAAFAVVAAGSGPAMAQGVVRSSHGDWQMRCETPPGARSEQCALVQNVAAEDRPNVTLLVIALKTADNQSRLLRVVAPLGVLLPAGLGLKIDDKDIGRAGSVRCLNTGCIAEVVMDDALIAGLKAGQNATFIVFQTPEEGVGIPVSLTGFGEGLEKLP
jgi:invasion protein IalB